MNDLTRHIQNEVSWCILITDVIILIDDTRAAINYKLESWREKLES